MDTKDAVIILLICITICISMSVIYGLHGLAAAPSMCLMVTLGYFIIKDDD